jgi:hypothetical protein
MMKWVRAGATREEVASRLGISKATLDRRLETAEFRGAWDTAQSELKISLRTKQVELALGGNTTMLVWLGKQLLGQRDRLDTEVSGKNGTPIEINDVSQKNMFKGRIDSIVARIEAGSVSPKSD